MIPQVILKKYQVISKFIGRHCSIMEKTGLSPLDPSSFSRPGKNISHYSLFLNPDTP